MTDADRHAIYDLVRTYGLGLFTLLGTAVTPEQRIAAVVCAELDAEARKALHRATGEALNSGDGSYRP